MPPLAAAPAQHNAADDQQEAQQERDDVAEAREQRRRARRAEGRHRSRPAFATAATSRTWPRASITALIPVGVERITGMPSSAARSRAWARCCGGPQRPNQASFDGLKMKSGRLLLGRPHGRKR